MNILKEKIKFKVKNNYTKETNILPESRQQWCFLMLVNKSERAKLFV